MDHLANCYIIGKGVQRDEFEAFRLYKKAADLNDHHALFNLGTFYEKGKTVIRDEDKAIEFYKRAAELGNTKALLKLGIYYGMGRFVEENPKKSIELIEESANRGNNKAAFKLGLCYEKGDCVNVDFIKAYYLYLQSSEDNNPYATFRCFIFKARGLGFERNMYQAMGFLRKAMFQEFDQGYALYGIFLLFGAFIQKDETEAVMYFQKSSYLGKSVGKFWLGLCYIEARGINKDFLKGAELIKSSSDQNLFLGSLYYSQIFYKSTSFK